MGSRGGVDYIVCETFDWDAEALIASKRSGRQLPSVSTLTTYQEERSARLLARMVARPAEIVEPIDEDRTPSPDVERVVALFRAGERPVADWLGFIKGVRAMRSTDVT